MKVALKTLRYLSIFRLKEIIFALQNTALRFVGLLLATPKWMMVV